MNKKKLSLILAIVSLIISLLCPSNYAFIGLTIAIALAVAAIVLNKMSVKENTDGKNSKSSTVIAIISIAIAGLSMIAVIAMNNDKLRNSIFCSNESMVKECVNNNDGTSTCKYMSESIKCTTEKLKESQFKK